MHLFLLAVVVTSLLWLPSCDSGKSQQKKKRQQPQSIPRLRKRTTDAASLPRFTDDLHRRTYEEWTAFSPEVLNLIAMEHNILIPPRANRALVLHNYFQNTVTPQTTNVIQPPIINLPTITSALPIRIPLSVANARPYHRPLAPTVPTSNRFHFLVDPANSATSTPISFTSTASSTITTQIPDVPDNQPTLTSSQHSQRVPATATTAPLTTTRPSPPILRLPVTMPTLYTGGVTHASSSDPQRPATTVPAYPDLTNQIRNAVHQAIASQNSAVLQEISTLNDRITVIQDSQDAVIASAYAATATCPTADMTPQLPLPVLQQPLCAPPGLPTYAVNTPTTSTPSFPFNVPDPVVYSYVSTASPTVSTASTTTTTVWLV